MLILGEEANKRVLLTRTSGRHSPDTLDHLHGLVGNGDYLKGMFFSAAVCPTRRSRSANSLGSSELSVAKADVRKSRMLTVAS